MINVEIAREIQRNLNSIAINSFWRTRPFKGFPSEIMTKYLVQARAMRTWIEDVGLPVDLTNLNAAINALADAILDFRRNGGMFEPAKRSGPDLKRAKDVHQFAKFLAQQISEEPVPGEQWGDFPKYWIQFMNDFNSMIQTYGNMK